MRSTLNMSTNLARRFRGRGGDDRGGEDRGEEDRGGGELRGEEDRGGGTPREMASSSRHRIVAPGSGARSSGGGSGRREVLEGTYLRLVWDVFVFRFGDRAPGTP